MAFLRTKALWQLPGGEITLGIRTLLTARIDLVTGGRGTKPDPAAVLDRAFKLEEAGADVVEINPGPRTLSFDPPGSDEELPRLVPTLRRLGPRLSVPISVRTPNATTAKRAIGLGASVIHDISGLAYDSALAPAVNETDAALVLGHMRGTPAQWKRLEPLTRLGPYVRNELGASLLRAHKAGIDRRRIVLDPGLEHGKRGRENFNLLRSLHALVPPGQGVQVEFASKRFLLDSVRATSEERAAALAVAATLALESGAHLLTVERPEAVRLATDVVDRIYVGDEGATG